VLAYREFEAFFLPSISRMAGHKLVSPEGIERLGLMPGSVFNGTAESVRGVKEWLSRHMPPVRSYKPTLDQLPMARMVDFQMLRESNPPLPCFGSLERAVRFLQSQVHSGSAAVYPPSTALPPTP
jgi:hypothetical protein